MRYKFHCYRDTKSGITKFFNNYKEAVKFFNDQISENLVGYIYFKLEEITLYGDKITIMEVKNK